MMNCSKKSLSSKFSEPFDDLLSLRSTTAIHSSSPSALHVGSSSDLVVQENCSLRAPGTGLAQGQEGRNLSKPTGETSRPSQSALMSDHLQAISRRFNLISSWLCTELLRPTLTWKQRLAVARHFILIGHHFLNLHNFNGVSLLFLPAKFCFLSKYLFSFFSFQR